MQQAQAKLKASFGGRWTHNILAPEVNCNYAALDYLKEWKAHLDIYTLA